MGCLVLCLLERTTRFSPFIFAHAVVTANEEENDIQQRSIDEIDSGKNSYTDSDDSKKSNSLSSERSPAHRREEVTSLMLPPIFVLNLDRSVDRWARSQASMEKAGLDVIRLSAVDGRKLSREELDAQSTKLALYLQPRGVIGCYLSHRKFWQMAVDDNLQYAIIMEDDVRLVDDFKEKLYDNIEELRTQVNASYYHIHIIHYIIFTIYYSLYTIHYILFTIIAIHHKGHLDDFDVLLLGAIGSVHPKGKDNLLNKFFAAYMGGTRRTIAITEHYYQPHKPAGTHAYMVSLDG